MKNNITIFSMMISKNITLKNKEISIKKVSVTRNIRIQNKYQLLHGYKSLHFFLPLEFISKFYLI